MLGGSTPAEVEPNEPKSLFCPEITRKRFLEIPVISVTIIVEIQSHSQRPIPNTSTAIVIL